MKRALGVGLENVAGSAREKWVVAAAATVGLGVVQRSAASSMPDLARRAGNARRLPRQRHVLSAAANYTANLRRARRVLARRTGNARRLPRQRHVLSAAANFAAHLRRARRVLARRAGNAAGLRRARRVLARRTGNARRLPRQRHVLSAAANLAAHLRRARRVLARRAGNAAGLRRARRVLARRTGNAVGLFVHPRAPKLARRAANAFWVQVAGVGGYKVPAAAACFARDARELRSDVAVPRGAVAGVADAQSSMRLFIHARAVPAAATVAGGGHVQTTCFSVVLAGTGWMSQ